MTDTTPALGMLEHALSLAEAGFRIFPLKPGTKVPAIKEWQKRATRDINIINQIWSKDTYNIGVLCDCLVVVDVDIRESGSGISALKQLVEDGIFHLNTRVVRTASGGLHVYYRGEDFGQSAGKIAEFIDHKSGRSFVVGPGSRIGSATYTVVVDKDIALCPPKALDLLRSFERSRAADDLGGRTDPAFELDGETALALARRYLECDAPLAVVGTRSNISYKVACQVRDLGVSQVSTLHLLLEFWNPRCEPPLQPEDLERRVANAFAYAQNVAGSKHPALDFAGVALIEPPARQMQALPAPGDEPGFAPTWAREFRWLDPAQLQPRRWLYKPHLISGFVGVTVAAGGVGKTTLAITEALSVATGRPLLGVAPSERFRVLLWNGEDPGDELQRRIQAAMCHHGIRPEEAEGWLFVGTGREAELTIARQTRDGVVLSPVIAEVKAYITKYEIGLIVIDPLVSSHAVNENDNQAINAVMKAWASVAECTGCAVHLVHHLRKTNGHEATVDDARGASAIRDAARYVRVLNAMTEVEATRLSIPRERRRAFVRIDNGKMNMLPPAPAAQWFQITSVHLMNGDDVQVAEAWIPPKATAGLSDGDVRKAQDVIARGLGDDANGWRSDPQTIRSGAWVGCAIAEALGLNLGLPPELARVKELIRIWLDAGLIRKVSRPVNEKGKTAPFVEVGRLIEPLPPTSPGWGVEGGG